LPNPAVGSFAEKIGVTVVAGVFLDEMDQCFT
jgi:hypothetical protein